MGALALLAALLEPKDVVVGATLCLNQRHKDAGCNRCVTACPARAITLGEDGPTVDADACSRCGVCQAACPTGVFAVPEVELMHLLTKVYDKAAVSLACPRAAAPDAVQLPCLAALSAEDLAVLAAGGPEGTGAAGSGAIPRDAGAAPPAPRELRLYDNRCSSCPYEVQAAIRQRVRQAAAIVDALGAPRRIVLDSESPRWADGAIAEGGAAGRGDAPTSGEAVSRRDLLLLWRHRSAAIVAETIPRASWLEAPAPRGLPQRLPPSRQRLLRLLASRKTAGESTPGNATATLGRSALPFAIRRAGPSCDGCGLCATLCPTEALRLEEFQGSPAPGKGLPGASSGSRRLVFQPAACLDCGLCDKSCPTEALERHDLTDLTPVARRDRIVLWQAEARGCRRCGQRHTEGGELCPTCRKSESLLADVLLHSEI